MPGIYNFYDDAIQPGLISEAQRKGILGWTGENQLRGGVPGGRPIYVGFENNTHLSGQEHKAAAHSLHQRARRMKEMIQLGRIGEKDLPAVQQELASIEAQRDQHMKRHVEEVQTKTQPARATPVPVAKSSGSAGILRRLLSLARARAQGNASGY